MKRRRAGAVNGEKTPPRRTTPLPRPEDGMLIMAELVTTSIGPFISAFGCLSRIVADMELEWGVDGIRFSSMDSGHVLLAVGRLHPFFSTSELPPSASIAHSNENEDDGLEVVQSTSSNDITETHTDYYRYYGPEGDKVVTGIKTVAFHKFLSSAKNADTLKLRVVALPGGQLQCIDITSYTSSTKIECSMHLFHMECEALSIPPTLPSFVITMPTRLFAEAVKLFNEAHVEVLAFQVAREGGSLTISGSGDTGRVKYTISPNADKQTTMELGASRTSYHTSFSVRLLCEFAGMASAAPAVELRLFTPDLPLMVRFHVPDLGDVSFYLAPKSDE